MTPNKIPLLIIGLSVLNIGQADADSVSGMEWTNLPLSVRQETYGGSYDSLKVSRNPAILGIQPQIWNLGISSQILNDGSDNLWAVSGGYIGTSGDKGYGFALVLSGLMSEKLKGIDMFGAESGVVVSDNALRGVLTGVCHWDYMNIGISFGQAGESYAGIKSDSGSSLSLNSYLFDAGMIVSVGALDAGITYNLRTGNTSSGISLGGAFYFDKVINGSLGCEVNVPLGGLSKPFTMAGITWKVNKLFEARGGALISSYNYSGRLGFTTRYKQCSLNYTFSIPIKGGLSVSHLIGIDYAFGEMRDRISNVSTLSITGHQL